jgi:hypothetical protein
MGYVPPPFLFLKGGPDYSFSYKEKSKKKPILEREPPSL